MAESLLGGVLGSEDDKPEGDAPEARAGVEATASAEAFAAAVAAIASRQDPQVARDTSVFLKRQAQLLEIQAEHLRDEHALRLAHLAHQRQLLVGQRLGQAIRLAFQIVIAFVVIAIGIGIAVMLHDAFTAHNVVIDAFDAPAALAARGVTGNVVAGDVLDELTRLQNTTGGGPASAHKLSLSNAWSNQVMVEVPETGISLAELSQVLRARFGHDVHIGGALVQTDSGGLALTVRGDGLAAKTFSGGADSLQQLAAQAAQYLYAQSEPELWAAYLQETGRCPEALTFIRSVYDSVDDLQYRRLLLYDEAGCVGEVGGPLSTVLALLHQAEALDPRTTELRSSYAEEQIQLISFGEEERAWRIGQKVDQLHAGLPPVGRAFFDRLSYGLSRDYSAQRGAIVGVLQGTVFRPTGGYATSTAHLEIAHDDVALHDPGAAELELQNAPQSTPQDSRAVTYIRALIAEERGDSVAAAQQLEAAFAATANPLDRSAFSLGFAGPGCVLAPIEEAAGHPEKADAILALADAAHLVDCQRFRGDILDHRGDWTGAQQAYAAAVALAPDLPAGYYSWGVALARHGDLAGAVAKLQAANQRSPHWADVLKAWGDVLAKQGHWSDALAKYNGALKYAPDWSALKQARDAAARKSS